MTRREYAGNAVVTTLTGSIASSGGGTVTIAASTNWPTGASYKFHVIVDPLNSSAEKILVDSRSGTTLTYSSGGRGADGTSPTAHSSGATIWVCITALDLDEANAHINQASGSHTAAQITFTPGGTVAATNVQTAIAEVASEIDTRVTSAETALTAIQAANWVTQTRMADASVGTAELVDANVTFAKLAAVAVSRWNRAGSLNVNAATEVAIDWTAEDEDDLSLAVPSFTAVTMPAGSDGWWGIDVQFTISGTLSAAGYCQVKKTPNILYRHPADAAGGVTTRGYTWALYLVAGDIIEIDVFNGSGSSVSLGGPAYLRMARLAKIA